MITSSLNYHFFFLSHELTSTYFIQIDFTKATKILSKVEKFQIVAKFFYQRK